MAIDFDGTDDFVTCGSGATIDDIFDGGGSVAFWMNHAGLPGASNYFCLMGQTDSSLAAGWAVMLSDFGGTRDDVIGLYIDCVTAADAGLWEGPDAQFTGNAGTWNHIAIIYNADASTNDAIIYVNGVSQSVQETLTPNSARVSGAALNVEVGRAAAKPFNGMMEDVRLFTRALTGEEVAILAAGYRGPLGGEALWLTGDDFATMDHPDGTTLTTSHVMYDMSGNGNDGVPTNSPVARASEAPRYYSLLPTADVFRLALSVVPSAVSAVGRTINPSVTTGEKPNLHAPYWKTALVAQQADTTLTAPMTDTDLRGQHE